MSQAILLQGNYTITSQKADVTGDGIDDTVILRGYKEAPDDNFIKDITLLMEKGSTNETSTVTFPSNAGYNPRLFLGDFTGDGIQDVMVSIDSGGSGGFGFYYLYSFVGGISKKLFDRDEFNETYKYRVTFREGCLVSVYSEYFKKTSIIDVSSRREFYEQEGIYNRSCKLLKSTEGFVPGLNNLYPLNSDSAGAYNLLALQRVIGLYGADTIGSIETTLKWNGTSFVAVAEMVNPIPV